VGYSLGVDLGSTFIAAALDSDTGPPRMCELGDRSCFMPAMVYRRDDGTFDTGEAASRRAVDSPNRVGRELMRRLGGAEEMVLGGQSYKLSYLLGELLKNVIHKVIENEGERPESIAVTRPVIWEGHCQNLFKEVWKCVDNAFVVTEPHAVVEYCAPLLGLADGEMVIVYDLGGSTFHVTILRKQADVLDILAKESDNSVGGRNFDDAILRYVDADGVLSEYDTEDPRTAEALARVRQECVVAKEVLSEEHEAIVPIRLPNLQHSMRITRPDFEDQIRPLIERTFEKVFATLRSAHVQVGDLSAVLLAGGSSRIPLVRRMVGAELGRPTEYFENAVALGAAALAGKAAARRRSEENPKTSFPTQRAGDEVGQGQERILAPTVPRPEQLEGASNAPLEQQNISGTGNGAKPLNGHKSPKVDPGVDDHQKDKEGDDFHRKIKIWEKIGAGVLASIFVGLTSILIYIFWPSSPPDMPPANPAPTSTASPPAVGPEVPMPAVGNPILVGGAPTFVAVSPAGGQAYVANRDEQVVRVVDTSTNKVIGSPIPIPEGPPQFLAFGPNNLLYVSIYNDQRTIHTVDVIDTASKKIIDNIPEEARPFLPAVSPDRKLLFVPNHDIAKVSVIDTENSKLRTQIPVAPNPHWVAFATDGMHAYTADHESDKVTVIDVAKLAKEKDIPVGKSPHSIAVHPTRLLVVTANYNDDTISVIDTSTNEVNSPPIRVGHNPRDIAWAPDGRFAYVVNEGSKTVSVIETETRNVTDTIDTGAEPTSIAVSPDGRQAYVSNLGDGTLTVLKLTG
jgi:YVTN family beta-propeller protein